MLIGVVFALLVINATLLIYGFGQSVFEGLDKFADRHSLPHVIVHVYGWGGLVFLSLALSHLPISNLLLLVLQVGAFKKDPTMTQRARDFLRRTLWALGLPKLKVKVGDTEGELESLLSISVEDTATGRMVRTLIWSWFLQQLWFKLLGRKTETLAVGHMQPIGLGRPEYAGLKNIKKLVRLLVEHVSARCRACTRSFDRGIVRRATMRLQC